MTTPRKGLSTHTVGLLQTIAAAILANPKSYVQHVFVRDFGGPAELGCVAFHHSKLTATERTLKLRVKKHEEWLTGFGPFAHLGVKDNPFYKAAQKDLKLSDEQAHRLLNAAHFWPTKFNIQYEDAKTEKGRARALFNRIQFFIKTNGTDKTAKELAAEAAEAEAQAKAEADALAAQRTVDLEEEEEELDEYDFLDYDYRLASFTELAPHNRED